MDRRNEERANVVLMQRQGIDSFSNEALAADGVIWIVDALGRKSAGRTLIRFMAIGKADRQKDILLGEKRLKFINASDAVQEKVPLRK